MPNPEDFNLDFRPTSYFGPTSLEQHFGARIQGEIRRQLVKADLADGNEPPQAVLEPTLDQPNRDRMSAMGPRFMGGEYLPPLKKNEVEIARAVLDSVTLDVISVRARLARTRIHYRIVDEYGGESGVENDEAFFHYEAHPKTSRAPLSFRQMIRLIELAAENGLDGNARQQNVEYGETTPEEIAHFCRLSSEFYPELSRWFDTKNEEWRENAEEELARELAEEEEAARTKALHALGRQWLKDTEPDITDEKIESMLAVCEDPIAVAAKRFGMTCEKAADFAEKMGF